MTPLGLTQEKYLCERDELSQLINLIAEGQGLLPIGPRLTQEAVDKALKERMVQQAQDAVEVLRDAVTEI